MRWILGIVPIVLGCSHSVQMNRAQMNQSEEAIDRAKQIGAESSPAAAKHLSRAKDELDAGIRLASGSVAGGNEPRRADLMFLRAKADAELAIATTQDEILTAQAREIERQVTRQQQRLAPGSEWRTR